MTPTLTQMQTWFNEYNTLIFEGKLPKVKISFNNTFRQLGQFYWGPTRGIGIKISLYYDRPEVEYRNTLVHEMCHLYCYKKGWTHEGHGEHWKAIARKATRITGMPIQRLHEGVSDWGVAKKNKGREQARKERKTAPAIVVDIDYGTYHFLVKASKKVIWDATDYKGELKPNMKVYITDHKRAMSWQNSRSLHRGYKFGFLEYDKEVKPMLSKAIEVKDMRKLCFHGEYDCLGVR